MKHLSIALLFFSISLSLIAKSQMAMDCIPVANNKILSILQSKCNICHSTENPSKVFTKDNMNGFARKIHRQVFIWKRMPKGKEITLTEDEKQLLRDWINSLN